VIDRVEQLIPQGLRVRYAHLLDPLFERAAAIVRGDDDRAVSQRTALFAFTIRVASAFIAYMSQILLARWMGDYEYGIFVVVWVGTVILGGIACLGFPSAVVRLIPEYQAEKDMAGLRGLLFGSRVWSVAATTLIAIIGIAGIYLFPDALKSYYVIPFYLAAICLPMLALSEVQDGIARAFNWPSVALSPTFLMRPILILFFMAIAVIIGFEVNAATALGSTIFATWLASIGQMIALNKGLAKEVPKGKSETHTIKWLVIALPIFLVEGFYNLLTNVDIMMVGYFMRPEQTGVYFATVKTLALVHFVYFAVKAGAAHRFAQYKASGEQSRYTSIINDTIRWTFWPSVVMCVALLIVGKFLLMLFGSSFTEGYPLLFILVIGLVARAAVGPAESVLTMSGEQNICAMVYAVTLMINIALNFTFIPQYGLAGAAISTTIALVFEAFALYAITKRRLGIHMFIIPARSGTKAGTEAK
jgi:O-antigen/teichoic acid export membrane protein